MVIEKELLGRGSRKKDRHANHSQRSAPNSFAVADPKDSWTMQKLVENDIIEKAIHDLDLGFDDPANYGISTRDLNGEEGLIRIEIKALIAEATSTEPLLLTSQAFDAISQASYEHISHLADQILCNLAIVEHDNHVLVFHHCWEGPLVEFSAPLYLETRMTLGRRYNNDDPTQMPQIIKPDENEINRRAYFALVDYLTSSIARFMLTADSKELVDATLAVLTRWRVKLKAISYSAATYAEDALIFGEDVIRQSQSGSFKSKFQGLYNGANMKTDLVQLAMLDRIQKELMELSDPKNVGTKSLMATLHAAAARRTENYQGVDEGDVLRYDTGIHLRVHLASILKHVANGLYSDTVKGLTSCQMFAAAYKVGLEKAPISFSRDRQGNIAMSSDASYLRISIPAFENLKRNAEKISRPPSRSGPPRAATSVTLPPKTKPNSNLGSFIWQIRNKDGVEAQQSIALTKAKEVVSIIVPLTLTSPLVAQSRSSILHIVSSTTDNEMIKPDNPEFSEYFFQLQRTITGNIPGGQKKLYPEASDKSNIIPISSNPLSLNTSKIRDPRMQKKLVREYVECNKQKMQHWLTNESSVVVDCKGYIILVLSISAIILLGGIAIGVSVGERIPGVDPWGVTNYSWLVVGVVLVFAKSRYVADWPWHDFLRMRVVCSSVSDLVEVGKVSEDIVLIKLLLEEHQTTLTTTGPYNGMFSRRAGQEEGFAIDVPVGLDTLFAAGFIAMKVRGEDSDNVVVFDLRRGTEVQIMASKGKSGECLSCVDVGGKGSGGLAEAQVSSWSKNRGTIFYLSRKKMKWGKVLGLFAAEEVSFG